MCPQNPMSSNFTQTWPSACIKKKLSPALCDFVGDVAELESENGKILTASLVVNVNSTFLSNASAQKYQLIIIRIFYDIFRFLLILRERACNKTAFSLFSFSQVVIETLKNHLKQM